MSYYFSSITRYGKFQDSDPKDHGIFSMTEKIIISFINVVCN